MKLKTEEILLLAFTAYLVLTPVLQYEPYGIDHLYNVKRYLQLALLSLVGSTLLFSSNQRKQTAEFISLFPKWTYWVLGGIIVMGGISSLLALEQDWAFLEFGHWLLIGVATFCIGSIAYRNPKKAMMYVSMAMLAYVFFYLCRVSFFYVLYLLGEAQLWPGSLNAKALYSFSNIRFFNQTQTWTIPLIASLGWYYWHYSKEQKWRWGIAALLLGWGVLVFASGARGTILGVVVGILIIWTLFVKERWKYLRYFSVLTMLVIGLHYLLFELFTDGGEVVLRANNFRSYWADVVLSIFDRPLLGHGPMHYASVLLDNSYGHPHNWFLQFSYEWGIPVAAALLALFVYGFIKSGKQIKEQGKGKNYVSKKYWVKVGLFWSALAAFVHGQFSGVAVMPLSQMWFVFITGILMGLYKYESRDINSFDKQAIRRIKIFIALMVIVGFSAISYWALNNPIDRNEVDQQFYEESTSSRSYPRYWQQGKFADF